MGKKYFVLSIFLICVGGVNAQFYKPVSPSPEFTVALEKIVRGFVNNFENIKGESVDKQGEYETFKSIVALPDATNCLIYNFNSVEDSSASWQGILYQGDNYREALRVYRNTFKLLNKSEIQLFEQRISGFTGRLQEPSEAVRFTVSSLQLTEADKVYKRFATEIELITSTEGWQVNLNFFNKKPDNERK